MYYLQCWKVQHSVAFSPSRMTIENKIQAMMDEKRLLSIHIVENTGEEERAVIIFCQADASGISKSVGQRAVYIDGPFSPFLPLGS